MRLLLDTHVLLWWFMRSDRLKDTTRDVLADPENDVFISAVSTWEIAIKIAIKRLALPGVPAQYLPDRIRRAGLTELPVTTAHTYGVEALPMHHADPFDRMLIAQARYEAMTIVTSDSMFTKYDVQRLSAS